jgi:hypothetical protein
MTLTVSAKTYTGDSFQANSVGYAGPAHTMSVKDYVKLSRTQPKPTTTFSGVGRTDAKLTRTLTLTGVATTAHDAILDIVVSVPVGFTGADVDSMLNDFGAFLASASFKTHVKNQQVSY